MEECGRGSVLAARPYVAVRWENGENTPFELDVEHILGRKTHDEVLESRGVWWGDRKHGVQ
jgi:hypothetical protein